MECVGCGCAAVRSGASAPPRVTAVSACQNCLAAPVGRAHERARPTLATAHELEADVPDMLIAGNIMAQGLPAPQLLAYLTYFTESIVALRLRSGSKGFLLQTSTGNLATSGPTVAGPPV